MKWARKVLAWLGVAPPRVASRPDPDLAKTLPAHHEAVREADRVIQAYRELDGVLEVYFRRKHRR